MTDRPPRVLIVEDLVLVAWDYELILEDAGCHVVATTATGADALRLAEAHRPDLILMDVHIHGDMDGIEVAHRLRERGVTAAIIFATALGDPETAARIHALGAHGYLRKPVTQEELVRAVRHALKGDKD